ncbi:MAG: GTPase ObgE [Rhabdochlamydiaceae bacterium]|nr:GTPase ObgE [Rhabdochlamydiaceae bacterium]
MFTDSVTLTLRAGKGGNGVVAWRREKFIPKGGPCGGNGGKGGSIILKTDGHIPSLEDYRNRRLIAAEDGQPGGANLRQGRTGKDLILKVPTGTLVKDAKTGEILHDFTEADQEWVICQGGKGGKGNNCFKTPTHQAPNICTLGTDGGIREVQLELKLIADIGFIGMPNAGKSTLMRQITHVPVKIAAYPFTTLFPNLSYVQFDDYSRILVADIPGIIEDAHQNKGLGISFLKHIERSSALVYVIDISAMEGRDPREDFRILQNELKEYRPDLLEKPFLVALNKIDSEEATEHAKLFREEYPYARESLFEISAMNGQGVNPLLEAMRRLAQLQVIRYS